METARLAKPPPVSYGGLALAKTAAQPAEEVQTRSAGAAAQRVRPMEEKAEPTLIYLHPDGKMALKQYALGQGLGVKVHDLLIEAMEEWADKRGLSTTFRVPTDRKRRAR